MATLYVDNVPDDLYEALRKQARQHRKSIAAEVEALLALRLRRRSKGRFPSAEQMLREDRAR